MWRQKLFPGDQDSDQSISEEEDFIVDLREYCVSLGGHSENEELLQLQSRQDILEGIHEVNYGRNASNLTPEKQIGIVLEDEAEMPEFPDEVGFVFSPRKASTCDSDEEAISDDEKANTLPRIPVMPSRKTFQKDGFHDLGSERLDGENIWSTVSREAKALIGLSENAVCLSSSQSSRKVNKSSKGIQSKSKQKLSFRIQSHMERLPSHSISKGNNGGPCKVDELTKRLETTDCTKCSIAELLEGLPGKKTRESEMMPDEVEDPHWFDEHTVAENSDGLQDNPSMLRRNMKMDSRTRGNQIQVAARKKISQTGDRTIDCEDLEPVGSRSSSDDEANYQNPKIAVPDAKRQTIADRFLEVLGSTSRDEAALITVPRAPGVGLFGKLQQVMQREKETDGDFLKIKTSPSPDNEPTCFDVIILSRHLDAKLIVCHVLSIKHIENPQQPQSIQKVENERRERTVIFNPRVCCDIDLEVGNLIRIHRPWKEVHMWGNDESIVLSTYFSQISTCATS